MPIPRSTPAKKGDTYVSIENLVGTRYADNLNGTNEINIIDGQLGNDNIKGYRGNDTLIGGTGSDSFIFNSVLDTNDNVDTIVDYSVYDDTIKVDNALLRRADDDRRVGRSRLQGHCRRREGCERPHHLQLRHEQSLLRRRRLRQTSM